ncbi:hypothetical protein JHK86_010339 [Glycine max]|nr:hypothetical protein JHK86_010339 [Glycine max]
MKRKSGSGLMENDILLVGDDPWEEFVSCVQSIKILSSVEVPKMSLDGDVVLMGLYETIEKMIPDRRTRFLVHQQLDRFRTTKVAELLDTRELVGVVRGIIKNMGTLSRPFLKMGCILGLGVSPTYRRKGVALRLVTVAEEWMARNGVEHALLATENKNDASKNLFTIKSNYVNLSSLVIFVQPISSLTKQISMDIKIDRVDIDLAISLYKRTMRTKDLYPLDKDVIPKEKLSLGTWVCYYKEEG